ncbi:MAG: LysR family transcriptional regulator [Pigmentiphaga sp.]|uniref:LysR family transcriptional regulator n=1 Tax=Pigmentiphaga sp. TaxID=1977564 RepID=UPI003B5852BC
MLQPQALRYFAEVVRTGSLRRASELFFVAPSAISRQIVNLEQELGAPLFERSPRGMLPTEAGRMLFEFVRDSDHRIERIRSDLHDLTDLRRGTVRLAVIEAVTGDFLPALMTRFSAEYPGIDFHVEVCGTHQIADRVVGESAEIGLAFDVLSREDLVLQGRLAQPLQVICRPSHPLARRKSLRMADLAGERMVLPDETFGTRYLIDHAAMRAGVTLSVHCVANSLQLLKTLVAGSDVISCMPPLTFAHEEAAGLLAGVPVSDKSCRQASLDIITARHHKLSAAARAFLEPLLAKCKGR